MRRALLTLGLVVGLMAAACDGVTEVKPGQSFDLRVGGTAVLPDSTYALHFAGVPQDSRCPANVQCIWAGDGVARLDVIAAAETTFVELHTNPSVGAASARLGSWVVELLALVPQPRAGQKISAEEYVATLRARQP